jgi:hypothetical protein
VARRARPSLALDQVRDFLLCSYLTLPQAALYSTGQCLVNLIELHGSVSCLKFQLIRVTALKVQDDGFTAISPHTNYCPHTSLSSGLIAGTPAAACPRKSCTTSVLHYNLARIHGSTWRKLGMFNVVILDHREASNNATVEVSNSFSLIWS